MLSAVGAVEAAIPAVAAAVEKTVGVAVWECRLLCPLPLPLMHFQVKFRFVYTPSCLSYLLNRFQFICSILTLEINYLLYLIDSFVHASLAPRF